MLITGNSLSLIEATKLELQKAFVMKDLGELKKFWDMNSADQPKNFDES